jgi:quinol monooxygenase YgiN
MEMFLFARFHALPGKEAEVQRAILAVLEPSRAEPGCLDIQAFRSLRDPRLYYIHSRWRDEAAFEIHAALPHTVRFIETVAPLIDHPLDLVRTERIVTNQ